MREIFVTFLEYLNFNVLNFSNVILAIFTHFHNLALQICKIQMTQEYAIFRLTRTSGQSLGLFVFVLLTKFLCSCKLNVYQVCHLKFHCPLLIPIALAYASHNGIKSFLKKNYHFLFSLQFHTILKFSFSEKATKIYPVLLMVLTFNW